MSSAMHAAGGILSGAEIAKQVDLGAIRIDLFDPMFLNPASVDLRLGSSFLMYQHPTPGTHDDEGRWLVTKCLDCKDELTLRIIPGHIGDEGFVLEPGQLYLMHTLERVWTDRFVPVLDGKSSLGRLGVSAHVTAGYGDPGFDGQYTLEVTAVYPTRVYAGMRFCQMRFHTIVGDHVDLYQRRGNYVGEHSEGPVASRVYKQFAGKS